MGTVSTLMTFEEFEQLPETPGKRELLRGELIELPPAKKRHNKIAELFFLAFLSAVQRFRDKHPEIPVGEAHHEMAYRMGPRSWLQPDASLTHPGQTGDDYYEGAPLIAVEVVSEEKTADSIEGKIQEYLAHGGGEVWVVYPKRKSVRVYRETGAELYENSLATDLLPTFSLDLGSLFASA